MYAVIETGGKQYRVSEGDIITVEKLNAEVDSQVEFDKVLLIGENGDVHIGAPYLESAKVFGNVLENGKGKKVIIFKYKAKKDYRKKQGHRQPFTMVQIDDIAADGKAKPKKAKPEKEETVVTEELIAPEAVTEELIAPEPVTEESAPEPVTEESAPEPVTEESAPEPEEKPVAVKKTAAKKPAVKKTTTDKSELI